MFPESLIDANTGMSGFWISLADRDLIWTILPNSFVCKILRFPNWSLQKHLF